MHLGFRPCAGRATIADSPRGQGQNPSTEAHRAPLLATILALHYRRLCFVSPLQLEARSGNSNRSVRAPLPWDIASLGVALISLCGEGLPLPTGRVGCGAASAPT
eukprot:1777966-Alexandrium_andersonii.AAC.1